jgi:hypothetical protein
MVYGATWAWRQGDTAAGEGDAAVNAGRLGGSCERLGGGIIAGWCARIDLPAPGGPNISRLWAERLHQIESRHILGEAGQVGTSSRALWGPAWRLS